ncbi:MAG: glycosyltransferase family 39 protein [Bacteroidota bacterium]
MRFSWLVFLVIVLLMGSAIFLQLEDVRVLEWIKPFFGHEKEKSDGYLADLIRLASSEVGWIGALLLLSWIFTRYANFSQIIKKIDDIFLHKPALTIGIILVIFFCGSLFVSTVVLKEFPNSSDEYVYLLQAETLSQGEFWDPPHKLHQFFNFNHVAQKDGMRVGRFPPGWPMILSLAYVLGFPPVIVNPILALLALFVFYKFARTRYDERIAIWSVVSLAFTAFFVFNSASFFSHTVSLLEVLLFVHFTYRYLERGKLLDGLLAGLFLGLMIITRYYTAVLIFLPFFIYKVYQYKYRSLILFVLIGLGSLPCIGFLFWYNFAITGNSFLPVTVWAFDGEGLGFIKGHSAVKGAEHFVRRVFMFLYWCSPPLLVLYFIFLWRKLQDQAHRFIHPEDYTFLVLAIGYFFYYEIGGNQYGPRFYFEALPFLVVFIVSCVLQCDKKWIRAFFLAGLIYSVVKIPFIAYHENRIIYERMDVFRQVQSKNISNAVVLISSSTSVIRPMPIGDLTRNDKRYQNDVIYARDLGDKNAELMEYYKDRSFYRYVRDFDNPSGELVRIR